MNTYETQKDRDNETEICEQLAKKYGGDFIQSEPFAHYDRLWIRGEKKTFLEIKKRKCQNAAFVDTPLDYAKVFFLAAQPIKSLFVVQWADALGIIDIKKFYKIDMFERFRNGDEPRLHAFYLNQDFVLL